MPLLLDMYVIFPATDAHFKLLIWFRAPVCRDKRTTMFAKTFSKWGRHLCWNLQLWFRSGHI